MPVKYCESCGTSVMETMRFCPQCGHRIFSQNPVLSRTASSFQSVSNSNNHSIPSQSNYIYAGFWERFAASTIDSCLGGLANLLIGFVLGLILTVGGINVASLRAQAFFYLLGIVVMALYYVLMESSTKRATFGKQLLGLEVADLNNNQISLGQGAGRYFGRWISILIIGIGYLIQPFNTKKQALHDMMAGTVVIKQGIGKSAMTIFAYSLISFIGLCILLVVVTAINQSTY
jgi:uncharacterized RDD family membrane protein YckC